MLKQTPKYQDYTRANFLVRFSLFRKLAGHFRNLLDPYVVSLKSRNLRFRVFETFKSVFAYGVLVLNRGYGWSLLLWDGTKIRQNL